MRLLPPSARVALLGGVLTSSATLAPGVAGIDPAAALDRAIATAEASLRAGEVQIAESHYRSALVEGWLLIGMLDRIDGRVPEAREAFRRASTSAVENRLALLSLALARPAARQGRPRPWRS